MAKRLTEEMAEHIADCLVRTGGRQSLALTAAGYSWGYANGLGCRLFKNPLVVAAVARRREAITASVVSELTKEALKTDNLVARFDRIAKREEKRKPESALRALENLGKVAGIYEADNRQKGEDSAIALLTDGEKRRLREYARIALQAQSQGGSLEISSREGGGGGVDIKKEHNILSPVKSR